jgi:hypothetical protein
VRHSAEGSKAGPDDQTRRHNIAAVRAVGQPRDRNHEHDIEQGKRNAGQERRTGIGQGQLEPDWLEHGRHYIPGGDIDRVDEAHHDEDVPALERRGDLGPR